MSDDVQRWEPMGPTTEYVLDGTTLRPNPAGHMLPQSDGRFITHADHARILAERDGEIERLRRIASLLYTVAEPFPDDETPEMREAIDQAQLIRWEFLKNEEPDQ